MMTDYTEGVVVEAIKKGLTQSRTKEGDWYDVKFQIHPDDAMNTELAKWPLGTRVGLVITRLDDAESPTDAQEPEQAAETAVEPPRVKGGPLSQRAGRLCNNPAFGKWIKQSDWAMGYSFAGSWKPEDLSAEVIRSECNIESRAELDHDPDAAAIFQKIEQAFYAVQEGRTPDLVEEQREGGPM